MVYDEIGGTYAAGRDPEPTWERLIARHLTECHTLVNVGAGAGSYEPSNVTVYPVEPSELMITQRPQGRARAIQGTAENLPLADAATDAAMTVLSLHHWADWKRGLSEMKRVAPDLQLILTFDPVVHKRFWLIEEYIPEMADLASNNPPSPDQIADCLDARDVEIEVLAVPADCADGVLPAFWARPHAYLDREVHAYSSSFSLVSDTAISRGTAQLADDLASGTWHQRHAELLSNESLDCGFRLIAAR
jgi:SAM-dependent methyltransferase